MFAREAATSDGSTAPASDRSVVSGALEPSVLMSPDRTATGTGGGGGGGSSSSNKRTYDMDQSLVNFSDGELDDAPLHTSTTSSTTTPKKSKSSSSVDDGSENPAPIPDLPRVSEDMVIIHG